MSDILEMIVKELGQGAKTLSTPVSDTNHESEKLLGHERFKKYQSFLRSRELLGHRPH